MMRDAWFILRHETRNMFRSWETLLWTFVMPPLFFYFIGTMTKGMGGAAGAGGADRIVVEAGTESGWLGKELEKKLSGRGFQVANGGEGARRLKVPEGFTASVLAGKQSKLLFTRRGEGLGTDYDKLRVQLAVYGLLGDLIVATKDGQAASAEALAKLEGKPRLLTVAAESAGQRKRIPTGFEQSVPGTMVMFTLLVMFTSGAIWLTIERNEGMLRRLAATPVSRSGIVAGKWGSRLVLGLVQIGFAMAVGSLVFGVDWGQSLWAVVALMVAYGALAASLGMLLGNFARTTGQVIGIGVTSANVMAALGGCWWPIEITPLWAQKLALVFPTGWAMDGLHRLMLFGEPGSAVLPHVAVMAMATLAAGWVVARRFRFQ